MSSQASQPIPLLYSSPEVIRLVVLMHVRFPLSLRKVADLLFERGIDICHESVRSCWNRFGPTCAGEIRRQRVSRMRRFRRWRWHLEEMYVKFNGEMVYLWRAVAHEGEVLESYVTRTREKRAALFMKNALKRHGSPDTISWPRGVGAGESCPTWRLHAVLDEVQADESVLTLSGIRCLPPRK